MTEHEKAKAIEKANSYRIMMNSWPWRDFEINILDNLRKDALEKGVISESMQEVYVQRGIVKCVDRIKGEIGFILENEK